MADAVNVHEAKTGFSKLLKRVQPGEEIVIAKAGKPVARLIPFSAPAKVRKPGGPEGMITIRSDFDDPLSQKIFKRLLKIEGAPGHPCIPLVDQQ
jgi:prevent-host-death family protein